MKIKLILILFLLSAYCKAQTVSPDSAKYHEGSLTTVCGNVSGTHMTGSGTTFINFEKPFSPDEFIAVIFAKDTANFKDYKPVEFLKEKKVCIKGMVKMYKGKAEIVVKSPDQVWFPD